MPDNSSRLSWEQRIQKQHDYYVRLKLEGRLDPLDQALYDLAMERERQGLVKPLNANLEEVEDKD